MTATNTTTPAAIVRRRVSTYGAFSFVNSEFQEWHDTRYKQIQIQGTPENIEWMEKLRTANPTWFLDCSGDVTCNYTFEQLVTRIQSAVENDFRTTDPKSMSKRAEKLSTSDTDYNTVGVVMVEGRNKPQQTSYHLHKTFYVGAIDGAITVAPGTIEFIPTHYTVKFAKGVLTIDQLIAKIKADGDKDDIVTAAQEGAMLLRRRGLEEYKDHKLITAATAICSVGSFATSTAAMDHFVCGPLARAYMDNTISNGYNFITMSESFDSLIESGLIDSAGAGMTQAGFAAGVIKNLYDRINSSSATGSGEFTVERAIEILNKAMLRPSELSVRTLSHIKNSARLIKNVPMDGWPVGAPVPPNATNKHSKLGEWFISSVIANDF